MKPILSKECVIPCLKAENKEDALVQMEKALESAGYLKDREAFHKDVLDREKIFSTYVGYGIGLPHGKSKAVNEAGICVAKLESPIEWSDDKGDASEKPEDDELDFLDDEEDEEEEDTEVNMIVMIAVNPESGGNDLHLKLLATLSRLLMHDEFRNELLAGDQDTMYEKLSKALAEPEE